MTAWMQWQDYLQALGLRSWQYREDGPLAGRLAESDVAPAPEAGPEAEIEALAEPEPAPAVSEQAPASPGSQPAPEIVESTEDTQNQSVDPDSAVAELDWAQLAAYLTRQDHRGAQNPVFGTGAQNADILIVGEAPGANEDSQGVPFVGRAGKLLDRMLFAINCSRHENVYITNICKFRPPDNRDPTPEEVATDWPILERQIELMQPRLVMAVGRIAAQTLLNKQEPLGKMRGHWHSYPGRELAVLVTYHPAFLLRSPQKKAAAWQDLQMIAQRLRTWSQS